MNRIKDPIRVTSLTRVLRRLRRWFTPGEWAVWLLGLPRSTEPETAPGLVIIQIDGLSATQLRSSLEEGRMPFVRSLLERQGYQQHTLYSGLPSSTPSVQGELFFGLPTAVPAFGFRDHRTGQLERMFASEVAGEVESRLAQGGQGLLTGGVSYCNIYAGGSKEAHYCASSFGWSEFLGKVNPFKLLLVMALNFPMFLRVAGLMLLELFLATLGFLRGVVGGRRFWQELIMIPARVVVVVLLRELVTIGSSYDVARGVPIVYLNLLGYDEQAHRRGPESHFAHWTLRGIDHAIRRIWKAAHRGAGREYDVWVMSDHGQESCEPFEVRHGKLVQAVVAEFVEGRHPGPPAEKPLSTVTRVPTRANWLGLGGLVTMLFGEQDHDIQARSTQVQTVTSGPLAFVYLLEPGCRGLRRPLAEHLTQQFDVPLACWAEAPGVVRVLTPDGEYLLPDDGVRVFGADHPGLPDVIDDMIRLVQHPDAGDLVLCGWRRGDAKSTSFVLQNGAHAGPGEEETQAFALLPADTWLPPSTRDYLRPKELRAAALRFMGTEAPSPGSVGAVADRPAARNATFRVLTYNVHAGVGMDGQLAPERIARVIAQTGAHVVCLQELDVFRQRSGRLDQADLIARRLKMEHAFHPAWRIEDERFGNAILTCFPMRVVRADGLHHHREDRSRRSALWAEVEIGGGVSLQVINTHMSIFPKERLIQARELVEEWIEPASLLGPVLLCGDFNTRPGSRSHRTFARRLRDVENFNRRRPRPTYFSPYPMARLDHMFISHNLRATRVEVVDSRLAQIASDHLPLLVELQYHPEGATARDQRPD